ncbi:MAG: hypothetical protein QM820_32025 [Minicystis sp.]
MAETSATAEGDLGRSPLAHVLVYALDRRLTGALFLTQPDGTKHVVRLARGTPVKVRPGDRYALLGEMLVEAGAIDQATLEAALATKGLLGDMLLLAGRIERDTLEKIAENQFVRRMVRLFELPKETAYAYFDGHEELADWGGDPACVDALALIWAGLRAHAERSALMEGTLALVADKPLRLHPAACLGRFALEEPASKLAEHLQAKPATLAELDALGVAPPEVVRRFVYALLITRQIDLGAGSLPLGAAEPRTSSASSVSSSSVAAVARMQLKSTVHRVGAAAPDMPGDGERGPTVVGPRASTRKSREAKDGGPDSSVVSSGTRPVEPPSSRPDDAPPTTRSSIESSRDGGASESKPRAPAEPSLDGGASDPKPQAPAEPDAAAAKPAFDRAAAARESGIVAIPPGSSATGTLRSQTAPKLTPAHAGMAPPPDPFAGKSVAELMETAREKLAARDAKGAVPVCEAARKTAPEDADVIALAAWVRFQAGAADVKALTIELDELLSGNDKHVPARYYRAMLRKRLSDKAGCVRDLEKVLELSPGHADAARELQALAPKAAPPERPSLFGRLFKR